MGEKNILIIEDDEIIAFDFKTHLQKAGFNVVGIADYLSDVERVFKQNKVHLVLCDIYLSDHLKGSDIIRKLQKLYYFYVIYLSGFADEKTLSYINETQSQNFLVKPVTKEQLLVAVKFALETFSLQIGKERTKPTKRELDIIQLLSKGLSTKQIADKLQISFNTVEKHRSNILLKYNLINTAQLISHSIFNGWVLPE